MTKYYIQVDTSSSYQSDLIEIKEAAFKDECVRCSSVVDNNLDDYFKRKTIDEFDDRIQTEYTFGFVYTDIHLIKIEYK